MSNFSKIVIIILLVLSFFFIKEKYGNDIVKVVSSIKGISNIELPKAKKDVQTPKNKEPKKDDENKTPSAIIKENETAEIYFLALDSDGNGIYKKVSREIPKDENKLDFAVKELLKGPNIIEKSTGAYSEVPKSTKLLGIKHKGGKIIIDLSSDFQYGGGTDSIYSRMMQLIKTAIINSDDKKIYLYLDGKQVNFIGGEGIMISQPLSEKSLEI